MLSPLYTQSEIFLCVCTYSWFGGSKLSKHHSNWCEKRRNSKPIRFFFYDGRKFQRQCAKHDCCEVVL